MSSFPADKRPAFLDAHGHKQHFPFPVGEFVQHSTYPDIAVSFPGQTDSLADGRQLDWHDFAMIIEVKPTEGEDPFSKKTLSHSKTKVQLAINARNLLHAHGLDCVYVLGIYGEVVRITRFDHSAAVVCAPLRMKTPSDLEVVQQFFWQFAHPIDPVPFVGWDPTVHQLSANDEQWAQECLAQMGVESEFNPAIARRKWLQI